MSPSLLDQDIEAQNICCETVLKILNEQKEGLTLTYRHLIKERAWDAYCREMKISHISEAFDKLDESITIPFKILTKINYKYKCTELCPLPMCLDDLHAWEQELIINWEKLEAALSWDGILPLTKIAAWHSISIDDLRRLSSKRNRIKEREQIYRDFQPFVQYIPHMTK